MPSRTSVTYGASLSLERFLIGLFLVDAFMKRILRCFDPGVAGYDDARRGRSAHSATRNRAWQRRCRGIALVHRTKSQATRTRGHRRETRTGRG